MKMTFQQVMEQRIQQALKPTYLEVLNESASHNVPAGSESHFKVTVVSAEFEGDGLLQRHRKINALFERELQTGNLHALALHTYAPQEWKSTSPESPNCLGGSKK